MLAVLRISVQYEHLLFNTSINGNGMNIFASKTLSETDEADKYKIEA